MSHDYINIPSTVSDPNYRYKMPRLVAKVEGRGNGIKTNVVNIGEIAKSLKRPPTFLSKFLGIELGANNKFEAAEEKAIVNGAFDQQIMQKLVDRFIELYVLCPQCSLPELDLVVVRDIVTGRCNACGHSQRLNNEHKLATYIVRNPPGKEISTMGKKTETKERRTRKSQATGSGEDVAGEEKEKKKEKKEKKEKKKSKEGKEGGSGKEPKKSKSKSKEPVDEDDDGCEGGEDGGEFDDDDDASWGAVTPKEKTKKDKSKSSKSKGVKSTEALAAYHFESAEIWPDVIHRLRQFLVSSMLEVREAGSEPPEVDADEAIKALPQGLVECDTETGAKFRMEIRRFQVSQIFSSEVRIFVGLNALIGDPCFGESDLKTAIPYLLYLKDASVSDTALCNGVEKFFFLRKRENTIDPSFAYPVYLNTLYQGEVLEEDAILKFYRPATRKNDDQENDDIYAAARNEAKPFLDFLKEGDESDEDDETPSDGAKGGDSENNDNEKPSDENENDNDDENEDVDKKD